MLDFDTPEIFSPKCPEERELGLYAKERLTTLLNSEKNVKIRSVRNVYDKYGRRLAEATVGGVSVKQIMVQEEIALPYSGKGSRPDWCNWIADKKSKNEYLPIKDR